MLEYYLRNAPLSLSISLKFPRFPLVSHEFFYKCIPVCPVYTVYIVYVVSVPSLESLESSLRNLACSLSLLSRSLSKHLCNTFINGNYIINVNCLHQINKSQNFMHCYNLHENTTNKFLNSQKRGVLGIIGFDDIILLVVFRNWSFLKSNISVSVCQINYGLFVMIKVKFETI